MFPPETLLSRRSLFRTGVGLLGLSLPHFLRFKRQAQAAASPDRSFGQARSYTSCSAGAA